jgi:copper chaperone CopZ
MIFITVVAMLLMMSASPSPIAIDGRQADKPDTRVCTLRVSGMTCAGCEAAVRMAARGVDGVTGVKVSYVKARAEVTYDPAKTTPAAIAKAITDSSGFTAEPAPAAGTAG